MRSFVRPAVRAKFGIAAASTAALIASPIGAMPAHAATLTVTNCNASGAGSLADAISATNLATGQINAIDIEISADCTVTVAESLEVNESVTIQNLTDFEFELLADSTLGGALITVEGAGSTPEGVSLGLTGLKLNGGRFSAEEALVEAVSTIFTADIRVFDSVFTGATDSAIRVDDQLGLYVYGSYFYDNVNFVGGAIDAYNTSTSVRSSTFDANSAVMGGAIYFGFSDSRGLSVFESSFTENYASSDGGAIATIAPLSHVTYSYEGLSADVLIGGSTFTENSAANGGGAIYGTHMAISLFGIDPMAFYYSEDPAELDFAYQNVFEDNSATYGGAIYNESGSLLSIGSRFIGNAALRGGAISTVDNQGSPDGYQSSLSSLFDYVDSNQADLVGAGIFARNLTQVGVLGSTISNNYGEYGAAVFLTQNVFNYVVSSNFAYNDTASSYPALYATADSENHYTFVAHSTFMENTSSYSAAMAGAGIGVAAGTATLFANIFASSNENNTQLTWWSDTGEIIDGGANLLTGPSVPIGQGGPLPTYPAPLEGGSAMVEWEDLDLKPLAVNNSAPDNASIWPTIAIGEDSVARDYYTLESEGVSMIDYGEGATSIALSFDSRWLNRRDLDGQPVYGNGFDVGAYEFGWSLDPTPIDPNVVITGVSKPTISATGDSFSVYGRGLDDVTELFIAGVKVTFRVVSANELVVTSGALPLGQAEILAIATDGRAVYKLGVGVVDEPSYWTKNLGNGQAKLYAKNIVGHGKVQFFLNGKEIAWINAVDETDPKLRKANGAAYLVRTVDLVAGKNRLEVKVDGVRVRFTTYSR